MLHFDFKKPSCSYFCIFYVLFQKKSNLRKYVTSIYFSHAKKLHIDRIMSINSVIRKGHDLLYAAPANLRMRALPALHITIKVGISNSQ